MSVNWELMAKPQPNGYDTDVAIRFTRTGRYAGRGDLIADGPPIWLDGRARWSSKQDLPSPEFALMDPKHPRIVDGIKLLDLWPEARAQAAGLLLALCPYTIGENQGGHGCSCGNYRDDFGWIYVTGGDPWGFAEGVVHETAHWKLRALGIMFEEWDDLLLDHSPSQLYDSPVRKDKLRPMGAVLHGQYSYVHVAEMVRRMYEAKGDAVDGADAQWLALQLKRIMEGQATLREHARGTQPAGADFLAALDEWTSEVLAAGHAALPAEVTL